MNDDLLRVKDKKKQMLPVGKRAQKEFIRDLLAKNQEKFEEIFDEMAEHDPKAWLMLYHDMQKHIVPKQSQVNVAVGINKDFRDLQALAVTKTDDPLSLGAHPVQMIEDADFQELPNPEKDDML